MMSHGQVHYIPTNKSLISWLYIRNRAFVQNEHLFDSKYFSSIQIEALVHFSKLPLTCKKEAKVGHTCTILNYVHNCQQEVR